VYTAVGLARDGTANSVGDTKTKGTAFNAVAHGQDSVGSLARLRDEDTDVITENRCLAVQKVTCQLGRNGDLGKLLKNGTGLKECEISIL